MRRGDAAPAEAELPGVTTRAAARLTEYL